MERYDHLIEVDEENQRLRIDRIFASGKRGLYTYVDFPADTNKDSFEAFARLVGENLLIDCPAVRKLFSL